MSTADAEFITLFPLIRNQNRLPEGKGEHFHRDSGEGALVGFSMRVRRAAGGRIVNRWCFQRRGAGRHMLGDPANVSESEARKKARKLSAQVDLGGNPQHERAMRRAKDDISLKRVALDYCAFKKPDIKPNSYAMLHHYLVGQLPGPHKNWRSKRNVKSWLAPYHAKPAHSISRADISLAIKNAEVNSGKPSAVALRSATSSMFAWAISEGCYGVETNPTINARKIKSESDSESDGRVLSEPELALVWRHAGDGDYGKVVRLLILTGCRRAEVGNMCWSEIDLENGKWTIPKERAKNRKAHVLPITPLMRSIIESVYRRVGRDNLFGWKHGLTMWSQGKKALDAEIGIPTWKHHDLRRSTATHLAELGTPPHIVETILNHQSGHKGGVAGIYNKSIYPQEVRTALTMWSDRMNEIIRLSADDEVFEADIVQALKRAE